MNLGTMLAIGSVVTMSIAPLLNKFASGMINWIWAAVLSSFFCFVISLLANPAESRTLLKFRGTRLKPLIWIALTNSLGLLCQYGAITRLDPPTLSILGRMYVVFAIALAAIVLKERQTKLEASILATVFMGAVMFCWNPSLKTDVLGIALCLAYSFFFALTHMQVKAVSATSSPNSILLINNFLSVLMLLPIGVLFGGSLAGGSLTAIPLILGAAFFGQWLGLLLFYRSLKFMPMAKANLIRAFSPIIGVLVTYPFFPVTFSSLQIVGGAVMVLALIIQSAVKVAAARFSKRVELSAAAA
ncbi:MAG: DMT family transporter [Proteobacteria bacterium]|nr:MAG: DMT family transporter [Pseudomonadota bacterium]